VLLLVVPDFHTGGCDRPSLLFFHFVLFIFRTGGSPEEVVDDEDEDCVDTSSSEGAMGTITDDADGFCCG
jgi:hypothetical protein